ncbi:MAG: acyl-ACP--UDP-N-acetylglucosamine O-acyltransferase [Limisphaerales bacterium]
MLHPTAIIAPTAQLAPDVQVGPYAVIEGNVTLGPGCVVGPFVHLTGHTTLGARNRIHAGAVIGDTPQDLKYKGEPTRLLIGDDNVIREHATIHCSTRPDTATTIGSHCFIMGNAHIGHDVHVKDHAIICNGVAIAGFAVIGERAFLSANSLVHQFCRVGPLALLQGGAAISMDLPPYCIGTGINSVCGLNVIGLRRSGFASAQRLELRHLYHLLFLSGKPWRIALAEAQASAQGDAARLLLDFIAAGKRGICRHAGDLSSGE